ncbi:hypothetical protein MKW92_037764 [Papaver armeniacum]|nr:hypothetical protein MKW92_037764 [Papaver armeniacum]
MAANKTPLSHRSPQSPYLRIRCSSILRSNHRTYSVQLITYPKLSISINNNKKLKFPSPLTHLISKFPKFRVSASSLSSTYPPILPKSNPKKTNNTILSDSITSIFAIGLSLSRIYQGVSKKTQKILVNTAGPLFFAAIREITRGYLNTPLIVVAFGISKRLDIYSGVFMVSWFLNVQWGFNGKKKKMIQKKRLGQLMDESL